jgi:hypothetical protein
MKSNPCFPGLPLVVLAAALLPNVTHAEATLDASERNLLAAIQKDPAWKPACKEVAVIQVGVSNKAGGLQNFCLNNDGEILAGFGGTWMHYEKEANARSTKPVKIVKPTEIKVYSPEGRLRATWPMPMTPEALCVADDGTIYAGGEGQLCRLDSAGRVVATVESPALAGAQPSKEVKVLRKSITGLGVAGGDVFMACCSPSEYSYRVYRLNRELKEPKLIVSKLSGCCGQMDIAAANGKLVVAHNARHSVESYDRDGKLIGKFGKNSAKAADGFGGCCEPKNVRILPNGDILAAESGPPTTIKHFTAEGKFVRVEAVPTYDNGCVRATVCASPDGKRYYLLDAGSDSIHVFERKP